MSNNNEQNSPNFNLEQLLLQLDDEEVLNQMLAARDLGYLKEKKAVNALLKLLKTERSAKAYLLLPVVITALGNISDESAITTLVELYEEYKYFVRNEVVAETLSNICSNLALPLLVAFLLGDNIWAIRAAAIGLERIGDKQTLNSLEETLNRQDELDKDTLQLVAKSLEKLKYRLGL